jgi:hypothetical protein
MIKRNITILFCLIILANVSAQSKTAAPKVLKEEKITDKHTDRIATYKITFKDGIEDKICQKTDGKWWVLITFTKDDGPYETKDAAIQRAYSRTKGASDAGQKVGTAAAGAVINSKNDKSAPTYLDQYGKYKIVNGKKVYVN